MWSYIWGKENKENKEDLVLKTGNTIIFQNNRGVEIGRIEDQGDFYANTFNATSDAQVKTNIRNLDDPLSRLRQLEGVEYNWENDSDGKQQYGVIAQQVEKILPDIVTCNKGKRSVNYNFIIPFLIESIKKLSDEVEELKGEKLSQE